jgi:riboflavin synthase
MFTGIIQKTSHVVSVHPKNGGLVLSVKKPVGWKIRIGDSISVNGVCSTVASLAGQVSFFYMPETLRKTYLADIRPGDLVNLEQSLKLSDRVDGHMVMGHVDAVGRIRNIKIAGDSKVVTISLNKKDLPGINLVAEKGSVALEGISLTTVAVGKDFFTVHLIPYTWGYTNLHTKKAGDPVNVEFDILAKYIKRIIKK